MKKPYVTILDGKDLRFIASTMRGKGYKMNHATVRNIFLSGVGKILENIMEDSDNKNNELLEELLKDKAVIASLQDVLNSLKLEGKITV